MTTALLKKIEGALAERKDIPLWGNAFSFPFKEFASYLSDLLEIPGLSITETMTEWREGGELFSELGHDPISIPLEMPPLPGTIYWILSADDLNKLAGDLLLKVHEKPKTFSDRRLQEGFYRYICLEAINAFEEIRPFEDLSLRMGSAPIDPSEKALCLDFSIKMKNHTLTGRLVCPLPFAHAFKEFYSGYSISRYPVKMLKSLQLPLTLEIGSTKLPLSEWQKVAAGDFLLMDHCSYDPDTHKGTVTLALDNTPLFHAKIKHNQIKILDDALYYEENMPIDKRDNFGSEDEEESLSPLDEEIEEVEEERESEEEEDFSEELPEEESEEFVEELAPEDVPSQNDLERAPGGLFAPEEIPLTIVVEVGRIQMNADKLLQLKAGNLIELSVKPELGVDLTINNKCVARGELVKMGEAVGIKILEVGE